MRDLSSLIFAVVALAPRAVATDAPQVGSVVDTVNYAGCTFVIATGDLLDADATFAVLVEHGDAPDLSDAAAVPDDELIGTEAEAGFTFAHDNATRKIGYRGPKRYLRLTITPAGNAAAANLAAVAILTGPRKGPVS